MLLTIDIGNTNITLGVFDNNKIIQSWRLATDEKRTEDEYGVFLKNLLKETNLDKKVTHAVISSVVVQLTERIEVALKKYLGINSLIISHKIKTNIKLKTDNPSQIGADRIANACAAAHLYSSPAIVVDFGTATSFDIVNSKNEFIGGIITAGMRIQAEALSSRTSKLPKLNIEAPEHAIGRNTIDAMLSGIVRGHAAMIDGLIFECEKELGEKATIIATGGYSSVISNYLKRKFDYINPDLTLIGSKLIFDLNKSNQ
ncbi:MAG: type III pantothenate kinase [Candidatus Gastranaerophilales bacterium]|nr:type III pantothenate kinase [Candidatus Gastranaerophilales bacterium]